MNGYEKLKLKIKKLEDEKKILIEQPFSGESLIIKTRYEMRKQIEKQIWQGDSNINEKS